MAIETSVTDPSYEEIETKLQLATKEANSDSNMKSINLESNPSYPPMTVKPSLNDPTYEEMETTLQLTANPA